MDNGLQTTSLSTIKLSELPEAITLNESDYSLIVQNGTSKKIKGLLLKGNTGNNGKSIEIQKTDTHIQWRQEGGQWINLVALADLKGDKGEQGEGANVDLTDYATKVWVTQQLASYYTKAEIDLSLSNKADISHAHTEYASIDHVHNYNDLTNKPTIPSKTSDLTNDSSFLTSIPSEYVTEEEMNTALSNKANKSDIPSLDGYATENFVTTKIAEAALNGGEVDLSGYATKTYTDNAISTALDGHTFKFLTQAEYDALETKDPLVEYHITDITDTGEGITTEQAQQLQIAYEHSQSVHVQASDIPTKTSDLQNDSGFITSIPEEYITETELSAKGYLTSHQDISGLQTKTDNSLTTTSKEIVGAINSINEQLDSIAKQTQTNSNLTRKLMKMIQGEAIKIVGFGDSTMYGTGLFSEEKSIPTMLQEKLRYMYGDNVTVINSGLPGSGAKEMFERIDEKVIVENPDIVIFWSGLNDAERFSIEEYNEYCGKIFEKLKDNNIEILVCSPICSMKNINNFKHKVKYYAEAIKKKASQYNLYFIDMFEEFSKLFDTGELLENAFIDEIHPKQLGYKYMCDIILKHICLNYRPNVAIGENIYVHSPFTYLDNMSWNLETNSTPNAPCRGIVFSKLEGDETDGKFKFMLYLDKKTSLKFHCYTESTSCVAKLRDFGAEYKEINFVNSKGILYDDSITVEVDAGLHLFEFWRSDITQGKFGLYYIEVLQNYDNLEIPKLVREGLTLQNNWTNPGGYEKAEVFRYGNYISVQGIIIGGLEESDQILFVLPENYRPVATTSCVGCCLANDSTGFKSVTFEINSNGEVKLKNYYGNGWLSLNGISFYI